MVFSTWFRISFTRPSIAFELTAAFDDGGVVLVDGDALRPAQVFQLDVLELDAQVFGDGLAAGEDGDVAEHGLAAIAEARSLNGRDVQGAAQLVDDQGREGFAVHVLSNDDERLAVAGDLLEQGEQIFHGADLLLVDQDVGLFLHRFHAVRIGDEVGAQVAAVELHAFDDFELGFEGLRLFDSDDAVLADLLHRLGNDVADGVIGVGGDGADLSDHVAGYRLGELRQSAPPVTVPSFVALADHGLNSLVDAALAAPSGSRRRQRS